MAAALITTNATSNQTPSQLTQAARAEGVKRPSISSAGTTEDWLYFQSRWIDYVKATKLEGTDRVILLLECCDEQLRKDLTRNAGGTLTEMTEDQVLKAMKTLAIREENTMVSRVALRNMRQGRDEPVHTFGARLRGQASVCKFTQPCPSCEANVDYTEVMVKDVLCRGLEDSDVQMYLLGDRSLGSSRQRRQERGRHLACCYPRQQMQWLEAPTRSKRKPHPRTRKPAHTVGLRDMGETLQQGSGERNAQPLASSAITATKTTTSRGCAGANMERGRPETLNMRMQYSTYSA